MPTARNGRAARLRTDQTAPVTHTGASSGPVKRTWAIQYVARLCPAWVCKARNTSMLGQPCAACQMRSGAARAAAIRQPASR